MINLVKLTRHDNSFVYIASNYITSIETKKYECHDDFNYNSIVNLTNAMYLVKQTEEEIINLIKEKE